MKLVKNIFIKIIWLILILLVTFNIYNFVSINVLKKDNINNYVYILFSPLSANEFLNHPILNIVLYNNIGKKEYEKVIQFFSIHLNLSFHF